MGLRGGYTVSYSSVIDTVFSPKLFNFFAACRLICLSEFVIILVLILRTTVPHLRQQMHSVRSFFYCLSFAFLLKSVQRQSHHLQGLQQVRRDFFIHGQPLQFLIDQLHLAS